MNYVGTTRTVHCLRIVVVVLVLGAVAEVWAEWATAPAVPLERLLRNVTAYISKNPRDAKGYYVLGRLHSLAFAKGTRELNVYGDGADKLPELPSYESIIMRRKTA